MTSEVMPARPARCYRRDMTAFPALLRRWRTSRRYTQERLAADAEVSTRHLSFLEAGKARPSRQMVLLLASALDLELRDRNTLLVAAGFAPVYAASGLDAEVMAPVRRALDLMLARQEPYGALVVDHLWNVLALNRGAQLLLARFVPEPSADLRHGANLLHALFHPGALRPFVVNWTEVAGLLVERLHRELALHPEDTDRRALLASLLAYPDVPARFAEPAAGRADPFATLHLRRGADEVRLFSMLTTIGTPLDVTAQHLVVESYFPADEASAAFLQALAADS